MAHKTEILTPTVREMRLEAAARKVMAHIDGCHLGPVNNGRNDKIIDKIVADVAALRSLLAS